MLVLSCCVRMASLRATGGAKQHLCAAAQGGGSGGSRSAIQPCERAGRANLQVLDPRLVPARRVESARDLGARRLSRREAGCCAWTALRGAIACRFTWCCTRPALDLHRAQVSALRAEAPGTAESASRRATASIRWPAAATMCCWWRSVPGCGCRSRWSVCESGGLGDEIRVRNLATHRVLLATIAGKNLVRVE